MVAMGKGGGKTPERVVALIKSEVAKLGQNGTARAIGIPLYSVQKYMAGVSEPTTATLQKLADYFKVEVDYLRGGGIYSGIDVPLESAQEISSYKEESEREYWKAQQIRWELLHPDDLEEIAGEVEKVRRSNQLFKEMTAERKLAHVQEHISDFESKLAQIEARKKEKPE